MQFSNMGSLDKHGFARNRVWSIDPNPSLPPSKDNTVVNLLLKPTSEDMKIWPHR
jgi:glucose-6-phosphate 1-epimerase